MKKFLLSPNVNSYKANLHCHSNISDGRRSPQELKKMYKDNGYSVLAITDHEILLDHSDLNDSDFLCITAYEMAINDHNANLRNFNFVKTCHINFYSKDPHKTEMVCANPDYFAPNMNWCKSEELKAKRKYTGAPMYCPQYTPDCINEIIKTAKENGFIVTLNHPHWSQESFEQLAQYEGMFAMEIFNNSAYKTGFEEHTSAVYDMMLNHNKRIFCVATDDNHNVHPDTSVYSDSFGGFTVIRAESLTYDNIYNALQKGDFYASTGPEIKELYIADGNVYIKTSPVKKINVTGGNRWTNCKLAESEEYVTETSFNLDNVCDYFRIEITDEKGGKAFTNAYFKGELYG